MGNNGPDEKAVEATARLMAKARRVLAYGGFDGVVQRPLRDPDGSIYPQFAASASGYEIVDTTNQRFVDWVNGWGPVLLGHQREEIERAIREQAGAGPTLSLMHPIEIEVAIEITRIFPGAEMVAFGKNGSDAVTAAVRVARAMTGRTKILQHGMHGFHDWYLCMLPQFRGLPPGLREQIESFPYGDLEALEREFARHPGEVAAVVMEPVREVVPNKGYLEGVREITRRHGALLVFDEIVTALRIAPGGAQEYFGVIPDLSCLGKSLGNGMPLSALIGTRHAMAHVPSVGFGMTFRGDTYSLAAARAVLRFVREHDVSGHLGRIGEAMRKGFDSLARSRALTCYASGLPQRLTLVFRDEDGLDHETQRALFVQECLKRGVFTNGNLLPSYAHDDVAVERSLLGIAGALDVLRTACASPAPQVARPAGGFSPGKRPTEALGFLEQLADDGATLKIGGWLLLRDRAASSIVVRSPAGEAIVATIVDRQDLATAYPAIRNARSGGFSAELPIARFERDGEIAFSIEAMETDSSGATSGRLPAFCCQIVVQRVARERDGEPPFSLSDGVLYV